MNGIYFARHEFVPYFQKQLIFIISFDDVFNLYMFCTFSGIIVRIHLQPKVCVVLSSLVFCQTLYISKLNVILFVY